MIADCKLKSRTLVEMRRATTMRRTVRKRKTEKEPRNLAVAIATSPISLPLDQRRKDHRECTHCRSDSQEIRDEVHAKLGYYAFNQCQQNHQGCCFCQIQQQRSGYTPNRNG